MPNKQVIFHGSMIGREALTGFEFNPTFFFSGCLVCGEVYQDEADRLPPANSSAMYGAWLYEQKKRHDEWREKENKRHTAREHRMLVLSGNWCTPEAAMKLAPLGIFSLNDLVMSNEVASALREAPRAPTGDSSN